MSTTVATGPNKIKEKYWITKLSGTDPELMLPVYHRKNLSDNHKLLEVALSERASALLKDICNDSDQALTVFMISGIAAVLMKHSGKRDFVVQDLSASDEVFYRIKPDDAKTFRNLIKQVKEEYGESQKLRIPDFDAIRDKITQRSESGTGVHVDLAFIWGPMGNTPLMSGAPDVTVACYREDRHLNIEISYNESIYEPLIIRQFAESLKFLLESSKENLDTPVSAIRVLNDDFRNRILFDFNNTREAYDHEATLTSIFENQVKETPHHVALQYGDQVVTYSKLNELANAFAHQLLKRGVEEGELVAIYMNRSIEMIVAVLGILKAGGVYVPFEPHLPDARVRKMLQSLKLNKLVTDRAQHDRVLGWNEDHIQQVHCIVPFTTDMPVPVEQAHYFVLGNPGQAIENIPPRAAAGDNAYIIHTSGSSGTPKGVLVKHRPVVNVVEWVNKTFAVGPSDKMLFVASISFDLSVYDIFGVLSSGGSLYIVPNHMINEPAQLLNSIYREGITFWDSAPAALQQVAPFLDEKQDDTKNAFRLVFMSGDWIPVKLPDAIRNKFANARVISLGGATEATIWSNFYPIDQVASWWKSIPYGRPIQNAQYYILDEHLQPCPIGVPGDLFIGGECLASGYINQEELTKGKFIANPFVPGETMYRTGDLARWFTDGNMEFLGRKDSQVKIRGHRIELGEIEHHINAMPAVKGTIVQARSNKAGDKVLCAYYMADEAISDQVFRDLLLRELPEYMVPNHYIRVANFPVTSNGKFDLQSLPDPFSVAQAVKKPASETEEKIASIYAEVLGMDLQAIGSDSNFFELGGHSLRATLLVLKIQKAFGIKISLRQIFITPVVADLAAYCKGASACTAEEIKPAPAQPHYALSSAQKRFYLLQKINQNPVAYNIPLFIRINGQADPQRVQQVFEKLIQRHESLRTVFTFHEGEVVQEVKTETSFKLSVSPVLAMQSPEFYAAMNSFLQPFDFTKAPLMRALLIPTMDHQSVLAVDMHHIVSDGVSMEILSREFMQLYNGEALPVSTLAVQYKDYAAWQNSDAFREKLAEQERYWLQKLEDQLPVLSLPTDFPRPEVKSFRGATVKFEIDEQTTARLRQYAGENNASLYMLLLSVFNVFIAKLTNEEDLLIGTPVAGRRLEALQRIVGVFVNTLLLRNNAAGEKTFHAFFKEVVQQTLEAFEHQDLQFEDLIEKLNIERDLARNPLFEIVYSYDEPEVRYTNNDFEVLQDENIEQPVKFDVHLHMTAKHNKLFGSFHYCRDLFKPATIERYVSYFCRIIGEVLTDCNRSLASIDVLSKAERQMLLHEINDTVAAYPSKTLHQLLEERVSEFPGKTALVMGDERLTYRELNAKANQLARVLQKKGVTTNSIVGIAAERSFELVIGIFAIMKAGAAYLPIDPDSPDDRVRFILDDSGAQLFLTTHEIFEHFRFGGDVIYLDNPAHYQGDETNVGHPCAVSNPAYIIYTSGTTGKPKGVLIEHDQVVRLLFNDKNVFDFTSEDVWTLFHSPSFDFSVWEIFGALLYGAKLVIIPKMVSRDPAKYVEVLRQQRVTVVNQTPSAFNNLLPYALGNAHSLDVRYVIFGGEALYPGKLDKWNAKYPGCRLINLYGITETTVHVSMKEITPAEIRTNKSNIGKPIPTIQIFILDKNLNLVPQGVPGELCISGKGLSRGYLNRPALTDERFVNNPFMPGERMYRSGDLVRMDENGEIEYLTRIDQQVKIRGHRIEPAEIKNHLLRHPAIRACEIVASMDAQGEKCLCAYYISGQDVKPNELREYLRQFLPPYMVPAYFMALEAFPLTANGKLKASELPRPMPVAVSDRVAPENDVEADLIALWTAVLKTDAIGVYDNFFEIGGNSLYLVKLSELIKSRFGMSDPVVALFKYPTVKSFAQYLSGSNSAEEQELVMAEDSAAEKGKSRLQGMRNGSRLPVAG